MITDNISLVGLIAYFFYALLGLIDLRHWSVKIAPFFFWGAAIYSFTQNPFYAAVIVMAVGWGMWRWPNYLLLLVLFTPAAWPVLLYGHTYNAKLSGPHDLLIVASIALVYSWPAVVAAILGVEVWRRWFRWRFPLYAKFPGIAGQFIGLTGYILASLLLHHFGIEIPTTP